MTNDGWRNLIDRVRAANPVALIILAAAIINLVLFVVLVLVPEVF
jgi:hypothetical protein